MFWACKSPLIVAPRIYCRYIPCFSKRREKGVKHAFLVDSQMGCRSSLESIERGSKVPSSYFAFCNRLKVIRRKHMTFFCQVKMIRQSAEPACISQILIQLKFLYDKASSQVVRLSAPILSRLAAPAGAWREVETRTVTRSHFTLPL